MLRRNFKRREDVIFLRPSGYSPGSWRWYHQSRDGSTAEGETNNPRDDFAGYLHSSVTLLIPSGRVLFYQSNIPGKFRRPSVQAIGWQLEKLALNEVENLHITLLSKIKNEYFTAAIDRELLKQWIQEIHTWNMRVSRAMPDVLALPAGSAVKVDDEWIVHQKLFTGFCVSEPLLAEVWERATADRDMLCYSPVPGHIRGWQQQTQISPMALLAKGCGASNINVLTGAFRPAAELASRKHFRLPVLLGSLLALSVIAEPAIDILRTQQQVKRLSQQTTALYQAFFPGQTASLNSKKKLMELLSAEPISLHQGITPLIISGQEVLRALPQGKVMDVFWNSHDRMLVITLNIKESDLLPSLAKLTASNFHITTTPSLSDRTILTLVRK